MSPLSTKYVARSCNIHGPSLLSVTRPSMVRCTLRNMALFFLVFICVSYVHQSVALQPYHHSGVVIAPHEDIDDFLLVEAHDEEEALPSFSPIRYTASPSGYIDDTYARLHLRQADAQQHDFARVVSSTLFEVVSMSQANDASKGYGLHKPRPGSQDRHLCDAIMSLSSGTKPKDALSGNSHFKLVYPDGVREKDDDVVIFQKATAAKKEKKTYPAKRRYSYSKVTGVTHSSPYTQVVMDLALFHKDFVTAYASDIEPISMKGSVKDILFTKPITLTVETNSVDSSKKVKVAGEIFTFTFKIDALKSLFKTSDAESAKRLGLIQEYFNTVISPYYGSGIPGFSSGAGIPDRVKTELAEVIADEKKDTVKDGKKDAKGGKDAKDGKDADTGTGTDKEKGKNEKKDEGFDIRADDGHYNVTKQPAGDVDYFKVGLDEIHRCMHQRINLVRAFCNPYTGAVNTGSFTKSTAFATDYMRIPTGQTILDYQIVVDKAAKKGAVLVSTHESTKNMTSKPVKINGFDITFQQFDYTKSPQFHAARTLAAFEWPVDVSPVVKYIVDQLTLPADPTREELTTALEAPFVYDRMNGYLEELTSVARTVNPDTIVNKLMAAVGVARNDVTRQKDVKIRIEQAFTAQLKYSLGTNEPRKKIVERVKRRVKDLVTETLEVGSKLDKGSIAQALFNWLRERVKPKFAREQSILAANFADIVPFELNRNSAEGDSSGSVSKKARTKYRIGAPQPVPVTVPSNGNQLPAATGKPIFARKNAHNIGDKNARNTGGEKTLNTGKLKNNKRRQEFF